MSNPIFTSERVDLSPSTVPAQPPLDATDRRAKFNARVQRIMNIGPLSPWEHIIYTTIKWKISHPSIKTMVFSLSDLQTAFVHMPGVPSKWCSPDILKIRRAAYNLLPQLPIKEGEKVDTRGLHELIIAAGQHVGVDWVPGDKLVDLAVMMGIVCALVAQKLREQNGFFNGMGVFELKFVEDASVMCLAGSMNKVELGWDADANVDRLVDQWVEILGPQLRWGA